MSLSNPRVALVALGTLSAALFGCGAEVAVEPDDTPAPAFAKGQKCEVGETQCKGSCFDLQTDLLNCGACGNVCGVTELCVAGACVANCPAATCGDLGMTDCSGVCSYLQSDEQNCGSCGNACSSGQLCLSAVCTTSCPSGMTECSGMCVDLTSDDENCGSCGNRCTLTGRVCVLGACQFRCPPGQIVCGSMCSDLQSDDFNCGDCGNVCGSTEQCVSGFCTDICSECGVG